MFDKVYETNKKYVSDLMKSNVITPKRFGIYEQNGTGLTYDTKEELFDALSKMIDETPDNMHFDIETFIHE